MKRKDRKDKKIIKKQKMAKPNRLKEQLTSKLKTLEQEFRLINRTIGVENVLLQAQKLDEINEVRLQLGLKLTVLSDYLPAKQSRLEEAKVAEEEDLYEIPVPKGTAPDTEGQIYHSLDLPEIECCRIAKKSTSAKQPTMAVEQDLEEEAEEFQRLINHRAQLVF